VLCVVVVFHQLFTMGQSGSHALSDKERDLIRASWAVIRKDMKGYSVRFFREFFAEYPSYQKKFEAFADLPLDEVYTHPKFKAHALTVTYVLSSVVAALDDPDTQEAMLQKAVRNHVPRGITLEDYKKLGGTIAKVLATFSDEETMAAWGKAMKAFDVIAKEILG